MKTDQLLSLGKSALFVFLGVSAGLLLLPEGANAYASSGQSLGTISGQVTASMTGVAKLITAMSYVAGLFFTMSGMFKFKAHKDNPTQVHLSQPIMLLCIGAGLIFLPNVISTSGHTIWGSNADNGRATANGGGIVHQNAGLDFVG